MLNKDLVCYFIEWGYPRWNIIDDEEYNYTITTPDKASYDKHLDTLKKYSRHILTFKLRDEYYIVLKRFYADLDMLDYAYYYCSTHPELDLKCSNDKEYELFMEVRDAYYPTDYNPYIREYNISGIKDESLNSKFFIKTKYHYTSTIPCEEIYRIKAYAYAYEKLNTILTPEEKEYIKTNISFLSCGIEVADSKAPEYKSLEEKGILRFGTNQWAEEAWQTGFYILKYEEFFKYGLKYYEF